LVVSALQVAAVPAVLQSIAELQQPAVAVLAVYVQTPSLQVGVFWQVEFGGAAQSPAVVQAQVLVPGTAKAQRLVAMLHVGR